MDENEPPRKPSRRAMLARLGLAATAAYAAPLLLPLSAARASSFSGASGASGASGPSGPSGPRGRNYSVPSAPRRQATGQRPAPAPPPPPELVVAVTAPGDLDAIAGAGYRLLGRQEIGLLGLWLGRFALPPGTDPAAARAAIAALAPAARVETNDLYSPSELLCPGGDCAAFAMVDWPQNPPCAAAPRIGMIDTGINPDHEALRTRALEVVALDQAERAASAPVHGTAVAALLVGDPATRTPGLLPEASLVAVDAFFSGREGDAADVFSLLRALDILAERAVAVVNMSLAGPDNPLLAEAVTALADRDIGLVAAAGNQGPRADPLYPAAYAPVVAVTAVDRRRAVYRQAGSGDHIGFAAPGVRLWTAASVSGGRLRSGTSYAAPFVTAAIAAARVRAPEAPMPEILDTIARAAEDLGAEGFDPIFGWGLVRAEELCP